MKIDITFDFDSQDITPATIRELLTNEDMLRSLEQVVDRIQRELTGVCCDEHHQAPHITVLGSQSGSLQLDITGCCEAIVMRAKTLFKGELAQTAYFRPDMDLLVHIAGSRQPLRFNFQSIDMLIIGRRDPDIGEEPDIDLHDFGAVEKGISRRHAAIFWQNGALHVADEGSANGTYLNGDQMIPHRAYLIRNGDLVTLGGLELRVWLE